MSPPKQTVFQAEWCTNSEFSSWILPVEKSVYKAKCSLCRKEFDLSNMGLQALVSHSKGVGHKTFFKLKSSNSAIPNYYSNQQSTPNVSPNSTASTSTTHLATKVVNWEYNGVSGRKQDSALGNFFFKDDVTKAEIIWSLKVAMRHYSYRSCQDLKEIFSSMFGDSEIARKFTLGKTKVMYLIILFGLAPYFQKELLKEIEEAGEYVMCFDESLNKIIQKGQMDLVIRFWNSSTNMVSSRSYNSTFLGHATAENLLQKFKDGLNELPLENLISVSMDGPNVNWKFVELLHADMLEIGAIVGFMSSMEPFKLGTMQLTGT